MELERIFSLRVECRAVCDALRSELKRLLHVRAKRCRALIRKPLATLSGFCDFVQLQSQLFAVPRCFAWLCASELVNLASSCRIVYVLPSAALQNPNCCYGCQRSVQLLIIKARCKAAHSSARGRTNRRGWFCWLRCMNLPPFVSLHLQRNRQNMAVRSGPAERKPNLVFRAASRFHLGPG